MALNFWDWLLLDRHERQMMRHIDRVQREQQKAQMRMQTQESRSKNTPSFYSLPPEEQNQAVALLSISGAVVTFFVALLLRTIWFAASATLFVICALCVLCFIGCLAMSRKPGNKSAQGDSVSQSPAEPSELEKLVSEKYPDFEIGSRRNEILEIVYEDQNGDVSKRKIELIDRIDDRGTPCVLAFCHQLSDFARFETARIIQAKDKDGNIIDAQSFFSKHP